MKSARYTVLLLVAAITIIFSSKSVAAQGFGTIVGTVTDPSGSVIPGAKVTVTDQGTGVARTVVANEQGYFVIPALHPSTYDLTAAAAGFANFSQTSVTLLADQSLTLDVQMKIGQATETVTVETNPLQVNTSSSTLSQVVEQKRIVDLPLNGRNAVALALLVPGTVQAPNDGADQGQYKTIPVAITVSANGSRANQTGFYLDGSSNNDIYTNVNQPFPFPDALQEFSVQTADYTARYGGNSGAVVNAITKSGTNAFHGDLFEFVRNRVFNAANYFGYVNGVKTVDPLKRNQFGGVIGGPIYRNHTFFFFGYQQTQIRDIANGSTALVPTAAELNGDFSALCSAFNSAGLCTTGTQLFHPNQPTNPYLNNQIPTNHLRPRRRTLRHQIPAHLAPPHRPGHLRHPALSDLQRVQRTRRSGPRPRRTVSSPATTSSSTTTIPSSPATTTSPPSARPSSTRRTPSSARPTSSPPAFSTTSASRSPASPTTPARPPTPSAPPTSASPSISPRSSPRPSTA